MDYKNSETNHSVDSEDHTSCVEKAQELLKDLEDKEYPEHLIDLMKGIVGELDEYDQEESEDNSEEMDSHDKSEEEGMEEDNIESMPMDKARQHLKAKGIIVTIGHK